MTSFRIQMEASEAAEATPKAEHGTRIVLRNTMYLGMAEVLAMPRFGDFRERMFG